MSEQFCNIWVVTGAGILLGLVVGHLLTRIVQKSLDRWGH